MWSFVIPMLLDHGYNMLLHSQRGHGLSTMPEERGEERLTTIGLLGMDMGYLMDEIGIGTPVRSVIGVSQGGATTLGFAGMYGEEKTRSVVVCGTARATPVGNKEAWDERTRVVCGSSGYGWWKGDGLDMEEYGGRVGMKKLAKMTVPRWFPSGSCCHPGSGVDSGRVRWMERMIEQTRVRGFFHGAKALGSYDVGEIGEKRVEEMLFIAGELDGGGKVGRGMRKMRDELGGEYVEIGTSGHLPMIDCPDVFSDLVVSFLDKKRSIII